MAKSTIVFFDDSEGKVQVDVTFDPPLESTDDEGTEAQRLGFLFLRKTFGGGEGADKGGQGRTHRSAPTIGPPQPQVCPYKGEGSD